MIWRPPVFTRTDTLLPYTTRLRSKRLQDVPARGLYQHPQADHEEQSRGYHADLRQIDPLEQFVAEEDSRDVGDHHAERRARGDCNDVMIFRAERDRSNLGLVANLDAAKGDESRQKRPDTRFRRLLHNSRV